MVTLLVAVGRHTHRDSERPIMESPMSLTEYLYVDERRLSSYFEQIAGPVAYDKVPVWKAGLQLTGPSVEGAQSRFPRPFTTHEKLAALLDFLERRSLKFDRASMSVRALWGSDLSFAEETLVAQRVLMPPRTDLSEPFAGLRLWVHAQEARLNPMPRLRGPVVLLVLIEDFGGDDYWRPSTRTGYSALSLLSDELQGPFKTVDSQEGANRTREELATKLLRTPADYLRSLGGRIIDSRRIRVLYRIRTSCIDMQAGDGAGVVVGYPIMVMSA
jgi:hypothetical protein